MTIDEWIRSEVNKELAARHADQAFMWGYLSGGLFVGFVAYILYGVGVL